MLTGLGTAGVTPAYPGGVFKVYYPVFYGGRFGYAHFGIDRFRSGDVLAWQMAPLLVFVSGGWVFRPLYRWDVAQNAWLLVNVMNPEAYGIWDISLWGGYRWR